MCTTVQPAEVGAKPRPYKPLPRKVLDVWDPDKPSEPILTGLHINSKVGRNSQKILLSKITPVCQENSKPSLEAKLGKVQTVKTIDTLDMYKKIKTFLHDFNLWPRKVIP